MINGPTKVAVSTWYETQYWGIALLKLIQYYMDNLWKIACIVILRYRGSKHPLTTVSERYNHKIKKEGIYSIVPVMHYRWDKGNLLYILL